ncbi:PKD domain-containing protein [Methanospirillum stamsii]|uniref:PKD domain-containing protein n=1 Tax=Methanospirillum stamsii TaxID=1277351 RepID=UPI0015E83205|nr:PKD domain-containing protein [Methanospirillum stamsii]
MKEPGISEVIAAILLIGVVVGAMAIVGVIVTQNINPTKIPVMDFEACIKDNTTLYLYHLGGDPLKPGEEGANFYVNLLDENNNKIKSINLMPWIKDSWSSGNVLPINTELHPINDPVTKKVQIVTFDGTGENLIEWAEIDSCYGLGGFGPGCLGRVFAEFDADRKTGPKPLPVTFTDKSSYDDPHYPITFREWNFGDGTPISNEVNPSHPFTNDGTYLVRLRVYNECGSDEVAHPITVGEGLCPPVTADFDTDPDPPVITGPEVSGLDVTFTDKSEPSGNITRWEWDFGDGKTYIGQNPPTHHYSMGIYWASLTVYNGCGEWDTDQVQVSVTSESDCYVTPSFSADPQSGSSPLTVTFEDHSFTSRGWIDRWDWDFGNGNTHSGKNPPDQIYEYEGPGDKTFTVTLTVHNTCGAEGTTSQTITVHPPCEPAYADFSWDIPLDTEPYIVQFHSPEQNCGSLDCEFDIVDWEWDFEDGLGNTSGDRQPPHTFPIGYDPTGKYVTLTVWNNDPCHSSGSIRKQLDFDCPVLEPNFTAEPNSGPPGLEVNFTDYSKEQEDIKKWRWIFGDTTQPYESSDPSDHTPPPHTYSDTVPRIYTVVLQLQNSCGQTFSTSREISVTGEASISGHLWDDRNDNGSEDPGELPLVGWTVNLEKRQGSNWIFQESTMTDSSGNYQFNPDVATAVFRVKIDYPSGELWKTTYSYRSDRDRISGLLSIGADRTLTGVDFGNVMWKTSSIWVPAYFKYNGPPSSWQTFYYPSSWPFDYTTSYDSNVKKLYKRSGSNPQPFTSPISYSAWGNSSFVLIPGFYNLYYKTSTQPNTGRYWLEWWDYRGSRSYGFNYLVPDNTIMNDWTNLNLYYPTDPSKFFEVFLPRENEIIPLSTNSYIEVHYVGPYEKQTSGNTNCKLYLPDGTIIGLPYDSTLGYNKGYWDNTNWEGETITLEVRDLLTSNPPATEYAYRNVTIDWEPLTVTIDPPTSEATAPQIQGITTVTGTVSGKWRDNNNVFLIVNNNETIPMNFISETTTTSTFSASFDAEPYAGLTIPLIIRAFPVAGHGDMVESAEYLADVLSKLPLVADFTADPWTGPVPIWVAFTDTSEGGANWWQWDFDDGNTSSVQNPITHYSVPENYSVTLEVRNITGASDTISKWVNLTGLWHKVEVNSNRFSYLKSGGEVRWIATVDNSLITVNNSVYSIMADDTVRLVLNSNLPNTQDNRIELGGGITTCNLSNVSLSINGILVDSGSCKDVFMPDYQNFHSNLQLVAERNSTKYAMIKWDNDEWRTISKTRDLNVLDLMPDWDKTMTLYLSDGFTTFDGWASDYTPK